jgi:hypothetical protein
MGRLARSFLPRSLAACRRSYSAWNVLYSRRNRDPAAHRTPKQALLEQSINWEQRDDHQNSRRIFSRGEGS